MPYKDTDLTVLFNTSSVDWEAVYTKLYNESYETVRSFVLRNSGKEEDAKDVFQESILVLHKLFKNGVREIKTSYHSYLFGIAKNIWCKQLKKMKKSVEFEAELNVDYYEMDLFKSTVDKTEKLKEVMSLLGDSCKRILMDFYYHNYSMEEIKNEYGLGSIQAAKNKKYRCLSSLVALCKTKRIADEF